MKYLANQESKTVAIIGGGWNGCHLSKALTERGFTVTLYEAQKQIFGGVSGQFGIRLHAGPHYPRSEATRITCRSGFHEFIKTYPELINEHEYSIYALGRRDADNLPSKVNEEKFRYVCREFKFKGEIDLKSSEYNSDELITAFDIGESSAALGQRVRTYFEKALKKANVTIKYNFLVTKLEKRKNKIILGNEKEEQEFDYVVNTTSFQSLFPTKPLPLKMEVVYQPCLALVYKDLNPSPKPISLFYF